MQCFRIKELLYRLFTTEQVKSAAMLPAVEATSLLLLALLSGCYAPVPRCSPFIIINKIPESTSFGADFNPYFPVPG